MHAKLSANKKPDSNVSPDFDQYINQRFSHLNNNSKSSRACKTPNFSARLRSGFNPDPNFSKLLPKDISIDKERLLEENSSFKVRTSDILEENIRLKTKLVELMNLQDKHSEKAVPRLKRRFRELQSLLVQKDEVIQKLKENLKSTRITQCENEVDSYIKEACRLSFLIERMCNNEEPINFLEFQENIRLMTGEMQSLKKENIHLSQARFKAEMDLDQLQAKLDKLENKKDQEVLSKKMKNFSKVRDAEKKIFEDCHAELKKKYDELAEAVSLEKKVNEEKKKELEKNEKTVLAQESFIRDMKEQIDKDKALKHRKSKVFVPSAIRQQLEIKLINPPRLLIKLNQILKKKKMMISVFLTLLDKNNNGVIHKNLFLAGVKTHGKKIKPKHVDEIMKNLGNGSNYIELNKLEELFEKYKYEEYYKSSSDEDVPVKKPQIISTLQPAKIEEIKEDKDKETVLPEPAKEPEKVCELVRSFQVKEFLEEVRETMIKEKLQKSKLAFFLFGTDFDPDEEMTSPDIEKLLRERLKDFKSFSMISEAAKFLVEPENGTFRESAYKKIKGSIRNGCRKFGKFLGDWEIYTDEEIESFQVSLKTNLTLKHDKIIKAFTKSNTGCKVLKFLDFLELLRRLDISFSDKMVSWIMSSKGVNKKEDEIDIEEFMKEFKASEPIFKINQEEFENKLQVSKENEFSIEGFTKSLAGVLISDPSKFPLNFMIFSSEDFLQFVQHVDLTVKLENLVEVVSFFSKKENNEKIFDPLKVFSYLERYGFVFNKYKDQDFGEVSIREEENELQYSGEDFESAEKEMEIDCELKEDEDIKEEYFDDFDGGNNQDIEEDIKEAFGDQNNNETSLEFEEYGIKLNS